MDVITNADIIVKCVVPKVINADITAKSAVYETISGDTQAKCAIRETINSDISTKNAISMIVNVDVFAKFPFSNVPITVNADIKSIHTIPVVVNADIQSRNYFPLPRLEEASFSLASLNLVPQYRIITPDAHKFGDLLQGQIWNHAFQTAVMSYDYDNNTGRYDLNCVDRFDVILDRQISIALAGKNYAKKIMQSIADALGMSLVWHGRDFISTAFYIAPGTENEVQVLDGLGTYRDIVSKIFGWAKDIPHRQYTVTWRNNTIVVVQRGFEPTVVALQDNEYSLLTKHEEQTRTLKDGKTHYILGDQTRLDYAVSGTITTPDPAASFGYEENGALIISNGDYVRDYKDGLLIREQTPQVVRKFPSVQLDMMGSMFYQGEFTKTIGGEYQVISAASTTLYEYDDEQYLIRKETTTPILSDGYKLYNIGVSQEITEYQYSISLFTGQKYIAQETQTSRRTTIKTPVSDNTLVSTVRITTTVPISAELSEQTTSVSKTTQSGNQSAATSREVPTRTTVQGLSGGRTTPFMQNQESLYLHGNPMCAVNGVPPQQSYPIEDEETLEFIARELNYLDKKTRLKRKISVVKKQIIDVDCRVILPDGEYYVDQVSVAIGPSKYEQTIDLVRWY